MNDTIPHGYNRYTNYGCRCPACKEAARVRMREYRANRPDIREKNRQRMAQYNQATAILRDRHPEEFDEILTAIREHGDIEA